MRIVRCLAVALLIPQGCGPAMAGDAWFTVPSPASRPARAMHPVPMRHPVQPPGAPPFYRVGPGALPDDDTVVIGEEAKLRPVYSITAPFQQVEVPLPPGDWTVVSIGPERTTDDGPAAEGSVLARLENGTVTGLMLIRASDKGQRGALARLPPNRACDDRIFSDNGRLPPSEDGFDFCLFVTPMIDPNLNWLQPGMPPALRYAVGTLAATHDVLPHALVGATVFRLDGNRWIEVTTFSDPTRSGLSVRFRHDGRFRAFVARLVRWTTQRATLIARLSSARRSPDEVAAINFDAPP